ncbi:hypothetical protein [Vineibacter terrae]|uniref:hypothetical protein n=1 Tax=Vineibacter terrae TaxID=2586908 RepID=UPI002E365E45|nr:hypothetical protein [Vineibacter terrae]HEX2888504.1 hypothetical protein [Vineibacter terrae]
MPQPRKYLAPLLTGGVVDGGPAGAQLIPGGTFEAGNWYGTAHERNGRFSHCAMNGNYGPASMYFAVSGNWSWRVGWSFESWTLTRLTDCVSQQLKAAGARPMHPDQ